MSYNKESGYGKYIPQSLEKGIAGKTFIVGKAGLARLDMYREIFGGDPDGKLRFYSTVDEAIGACTANAGDTIYILPGHTETISSATALSLDVAGITIKGLGKGSLIPTITLDTATTTTIPVSAADITIENVIFTANFADIVAVFTTTGAANFNLKDCKFKATATNMNFLNIVDTSTVNNAANGLTVDGCSWIEPDAATLSFLKVDADLDSLVFKNSYLNLGVNTSDLPAIAVVATGKDLTNLRVENNKVVRLNDANPLLITVDTTTANTGVIANNFIRHADVASPLLVTVATAIGFFDNKGTSTADESGILVPVAET